MAEQWTDQITNGPAMDGFNLKDSRILINNLEQKEKNWEYEDKHFHFC